MAENEGQQQEQQGGQTPPPAKTFTQEEVNALIGNTRKEERGKFSDYNDLKAKAEKYDQVEADKLSAEEKAKQDKEAADRRAADAIKTANERLLQAAFIAAASAAGVKNPRDAYALAIADGAQVSIDDKGEAVGVAEAVKTLLDAGRLVLGSRPGAPGLDAGAGGQTRPEKQIVLTDEQKYFAKVSGMTEEQYIKYLTAPSEPIRPDTGGQ